jgi:hypothetical protein
VTQVQLQRISLTGCTIAEMDTTVVSAPGFSLGSACRANSTVQFFPGDYVNTATISGATGPGELTTSALRTQHQPSRAPPRRRYLQLPTSTSSTSTAASNTNTNRGLSAGAKAGIAIVVMLGVAAIAGIVFFLMRLHRNTRLLKEQFESVQNQPPKTQYTQV